MLPFEKKRMELLDNIDKSILKRLTTLQNSFYLYIIEALESQIDIDGKIIKATNKNIIAANNLGGVEDKFRRQKVKPFLRWMAKQFVAILSINAKYFKSNIQPNLKDVQKAAETKLLIQLGLKKKGGKLFINGSGWLDQLGKFDQPYIKVRQIATQAVASGVPLKDFKKSIKDYIKPDGKLGAIKGHILTNANDAFAQFDRTTQNEYATKLNLNAFIYSGGLIDSSRPFCIERNAKVYTRDEANEWESIDFQGKNDDYNPLRDLGGHNCRHFASWISNKAAIRRRPELKDKL